MNRALLTLSLAGRGRPSRLLPIVFLVMLTGALLAPTALASQGGHNAPGNNGDVKVNAAGDATGGPENDPHVCSFFLSGSNFDAAQAGSWWIETWPPGGNGSTALSGTYKANGSGYFRTTDYTLPNGHYKLFWQGEAGTSTEVKHKVFWVSCAPPSPSTTPSASASGQSSGSPSPVPSGSAVLAIRKWVSLDNDGPWTTALTVSSGTTVFFRVVVDNKGSAAANGFAVSDSMGLGSNCSVPASLAGGASWSCIYSRTVSASATNTATASATGVLSVTSSASVSVAAGSPSTSPSGTPTSTPSPTATPLPTSSGSSLGIGVSKFVGLTVNGPWTNSLSVTAGTQVFFWVTVMSGSGGALSGVVVSDTNGLPTCAPVPSSLAAGASWSCTYGMVANANITNTLTASATGVAPASMSATVTVSATPSSSGGVAGASASPPPTTTPVPTATPLGGVGGVSGAPGGGVAGATGTPPATDASSARDATSSSLGLLLLIVVAAGLVGFLGFLIQPAPSRRRIRD